mgnify:CR=1 FL=1
MGTGSTSTSITRAAARTDPLTGISNRRNFLSGLDDSGWGAAMDSVLMLDIDDSPTDLLDDEHGSFYEPENLRRTRRWLRPGGVFALWTNVATAPAVTARLAAVFGEVTVDEIAFDNPLLDSHEKNALYFARC